MRKLFAFIALLTLFAAPVAHAQNKIKPYQIYMGSTVANLPAPGDFGATTAQTVYLVIDADAPGDCTIGGGLLLEYPTECVWNGTHWVPLTQVSSGGGACNTNGGFVQDSYVCAGPPLLGVLAPPILDQAFGYSPASTSMATSRALSITSGQQLLAAIACNTYPVSGSNCITAATQVGDTLGSTFAFIGSRQSSGYMSVQFVIATATSSGSDTITVSGLSGSTTYGLGVFQTYNVAAFDVFGQGSGGYQSDTATASATTLAAGDLLIGIGFNESGEAFAPLALSQNSGDWSNFGYQRVAGGGQTVAWGWSGSYQSAVGSRSLQWSSSQVNGLSSGQDVAIFAFSPTASWPTTGPPSFRNLYATDIPGTLKLTALDILPVQFYELPACTAGTLGTEGSPRSIIDSLVNTQGSTVTAGGGTYHVLLYCNGTNWIVTSGAGGGGGSLEVQTNSTDNSSQSLLNFLTSTANSVGLTITPSNPSGGVQKFEITGGSYSGTAANATVASNSLGLKFGATSIANSGTPPSSGQCLGYNGTNILGVTCSGGSMVYPGAGVANSTGSAWGTSYAVGTSANDLVQLNSSAQLPAVSAALLTNLPLPTAAQINTLVASLTGCSTPGNVYTPQASDCVAPGGGSSGFSAMTHYGVAYATSTTTGTSDTPPATIGKFAEMHINSTAAATAPQPVQIGLTAREVTGSTDTIVASDCAAGTINYKTSASIAVALGTPASLSNTGCAFEVASTFDGTNTPPVASFTADGSYNFSVNGGALASTFILASGRHAFIYLDQTETAQWDVLYPATSTSGGSMTWPATPGVTACLGTPCTAWSPSLTPYGSETGSATSGDPGTTAGVAMVSDGTHGQVAATGQLSTGGSGASLLNVSPTVIADLGNFTTGNGYSVVAGSSVAIVSDGQTCGDLSTGGGSTAEVLQCQTASGGACTAWKCIACWSGISPSVGMFGAIMSAVPTTTSTGIVTAMNGSSLTNVATGVYLANSGANEGARSTSVPSTPYSITILVTNESGTNAGIGWTDGTALEWIYYDGSANHFVVQDNSNIQTFAATLATASAPAYRPYWWLKVVNTGTNLTYWYSWTGIKWNQLYSVAIASGYLSTGGRGGYLYLFVGGGENSTNYYDELVESWVQGTN